MDDNFTPQQPPPIDKLAAALAKAQGAMQSATKDAANPFFNSKYADLAACWNACRKALSENGLSVIQDPWTEGSTVFLQTTLMHSSGQQYAGKPISTPNLNKQNPAQGVGSCATYLRRIALCAIVGIAPAEDDDGNAAWTKEPPAKRPAPRQTKQASPPPKDPPKQGPSKDQLSRLFALLKKSAWEEEDLRQVIKGLGVESSRDLSQKQYQQICDAIVKDTP